MIGPFMKYFDLGTFQMVALFIFTIFYSLMVLWVFRNGSKVFYAGMASRILGDASEDFSKGENQ